MKSKSPGPLNPAIFKAYVASVENRPSETSEWTVSVVSDVHRRPFQPDRSKYSVATVSPGRNRAGFSKRSVLRVPISRSPLPSSSSRSSVGFLWASHDAKAADSDWNLGSHAPGESWCGDRQCVGRSRPPRARDRRTATWLDAGHAHVARNDGTELAGGATENN